MTDYVRPKYLVFLFTFIIPTSFSVGQNSASFVRIVSKDAGVKAAAPSNVSSKYAYLKPRIELVLKHHFQEKENSEKRSPWGVMHAMVAFGEYAEMYGDGKLVKDVDWLCNNQPCRGMRLLHQKKGQLSTNIGPGRQGHDGQFLAILAQSQVKKDRKLIVDGIEFSINDLIQYEMATCKAKEELTFKLIGLSHYIDSDQTWKTGDRQTWSLERIIKEELRQPINGVACGGTHRLMGYSYALLMRRLQNKPLTGHWKRADDFVGEFREYAFKLQNRDGSFSTKWFERREMKNDPQRRVQTTGHILEWLVFSAEGSEVTDPRLVKAVDYLSELMVNNRKTKWEIGPKGHAVRALRLFYEKVLKKPATIVASSKRSLDYQPTLNSSRKSQGDVESVKEVDNTNESARSAKGKAQTDSDKKTAKKKVETPEVQTASRGNVITADDLPELPLLIR